jgi:hypothetical protein
VILTFLLLPVKTGIVFTGCFVVSFTLLSLKVQCAKQKTALSLLQDKLQKERNIKTPLPQSEHNGFVFTEVGGVTVRIGSNRGIDIPAVRTYREHPSHAAPSRTYFFANSTNATKTTRREQEASRRGTSARVSILQGDAKRRLAVATHKRASWNTPSVVAEKIGSNGCGIAGHSSRRSNEV